MLLTESSVFDKTSDLNRKVARTSGGAGQPFVHPDEIADDRRLTTAEKREILASWASDARAVADAPSLRRLDNGAVVHIDSIMRALTSLYDDEAARPEPFAPKQPCDANRDGLFRRLKWFSRWNGSDDDDPPPVPAMAARPPPKPLTGQDAVDPGLALVA